MPKRKQPAILKTKDATGRPLAKRRRWHSHGVERQAAKGAALADEASTSSYRAEEEQQTDQWWLWEFEDQSTEYRQDNDFYDRYLDAITEQLQRTSARRSLLDVAPANVRRQWAADRPTEDRGPTRERLEERIESPWGESATPKALVEATIGPITNSSVVSQICLAANKPLCATSIIYYAPLWLKEPQSFTGSTIHELIEHLFVAYPVPEVLYSAWLDDDTHQYQQDKWRQWFLSYAQGGSLFRLGQLAHGWSVSKRFAHQFAQTEAADSIRRTTVNAELTLLGVSQRAAQLLLSYAPYQIDVTASWNAFDDHFLEHWRETARWISRHEDELDQGVVDYLLSWSYQQVRLLDHEFSWAGRTVAASVQHADTFFQNQHQPSYRWQAHNMDWVGSDGWEVVELCSTAELRREGNALSHCVGDYGRICKAGSSAIFSLRHDSRPVITIQLDPNTRTVKQALGDYNRPCSATEMTHIQQWLTDTG